MNNIKKYWIAIVVVFGLCMFIKPALCAFIIGTLVLYISITALLFLNKIKKIGVNRIGNIIDYKSDGEGYKTPIIEFTTITGEEIREEPFVYVQTDLSKIRFYKNSIKQSVAILYDPEEPKKFVLKNENWFSNIAFIICLLVGLFFIVLSISSLLGYIKLA
ncbi:MAG: DUF3592 domain-containing protein [Bacteroidota bacterium]